MNGLKTLLGVTFLAFALWQGGAWGRITTPSVSPREAQELVQSSKAIRVDVRERDEIVEGMLEGAL